MPEHEGRDSNTDLQGYLDAIDRADDELASLRGAYMSDCKGPRASIREIMGAARDSGENMKAFRLVLKGHRDARKQAKRVAELEQDDADAYEAMREKLGAFADTPLGEAALAKHRRDGALDSLRP
jgi:hypothetical protein